ncbi:MAG: hypothetical protein HY341_02630, partial [Candidatus Kerfeldbacteria bacterium]|nr:hypothetical protein [Candidatus Kerfeldbacteria bacterium]
MHSRRFPRLLLLIVIGTFVLALPMLGLADWQGEPLGPLFDPLTMYGPPLTVSGTTQIKAGKLIVDAFGSTNGVTVEDAALAVQAGDAVLGGDVFVGGDAGLSVLAASQSVNIGQQSASTASQSLTVSGTAAFASVGGTPTVTVVNEDAASTPALAGSTESDDNPAVAGVSASTLGGGGVRGQGGTTVAETQSSIGVLGTAANGQGTSWAGYFQGRVGIDLRDVDVTAVSALQVGWGRIANLNADMLDGLDAEDFVPALGDLGGTFLDLQAAPATTQTGFPFAISGLLRADGGLTVSDATDPTTAVCQERYGQAAVACGGTTDGTAAGAYGTGGNAAVGATTYGIYVDAQPANSLAAQFTGPVRFAGHDGSGSFVQGPDLPFGQYGQTATTLPGGDVFIAGGIDATAPAHYLAKTRQYDGSAFVTGPTMATARAEHTATLTQHWWDTDYAYRQRITVNAPQTVPVGYAVATTVDTDALIAAGQLRADRADWRILYWTGTNWTELDRDVVSPTLTRFALKASIASGGSDSNYYVTYGNPDATDPPENPANVYFSYDDFSTDTTVQYTWEESCTSPTAPVSAVGYTYRSVGGESYVDITTAETCSVTARRQWSTSLIGAVVEFSFRPYATWPTDGTASVVLSNAGDASTNAYRFSRPHATHGPGDFNIELEKRVGGTPVIANSHDAFTPYALDDWHTVAVTITPSQVDAAFDGSVASSGTDGTSTALTFNTLALTFSQQDQHLDTIRVRPYVNPEPTTTTTSETYGVLLA